MKRKIAIVLILVMMLMLTACAANPKDTEIKTVEKNGDTLFAIYDYDAKYNADSGCRHFCPPATMTEENQRDAAEAALAFAELAGVSQLVRVDFIVRDSDQKVYILEGNGLPGMTNTSMLPEEARVAGITMPELCTMLVRSAFER